MSARIPWTLTDTQTLDVYALPVNPSEEQNSPDTISKNVKYSTNSAVRRGGDSYAKVDNIIFSSGGALVTAQYSGNVYNSTDIVALKLWAAKNHPLELQDDLGRKYDILMQGLQLERVRSQKSPLKHRYTLKFIVLDRLN